MLAQNASTVWPLSVRPLASVIVPEMTSGSRTPVASNASSSPTIAAFALSVSKIVSTSRMSAPPAIRPSADSRYAVTSSGNETLRAAGSLTSGEIDAVRFVGPTEPPT